MDHIDKLLEDDKEEKIKIADPIDVWADHLLSGLIAEGKEGIVRIQSKTLYDMYIDWVRPTGVKDYLYNHIQYAVRFSFLKLDGVKCGVDTKIKGRTCKCCFFDMDVIKNTHKKIDTETP